MSFEARYRSICPRCDDPIEPGQLAERDGDWDGWCHVRCPDPAAAAAELRPGEVVCSRCFTVHAGEC